MVNLDTLPRDREPYLGWYLETAPEFLETYVCYAWEDDREGSFRVKARAPSTSAQAEERFEASRRLSLSIARGKVFLGSWQQGVEYEVKSPQRRELPTPLIRQLILRGLHRLYEKGLETETFN